MATIDYEKEYDNRGRVKEHPEIFARWSRDAAACRTMRGAFATLGERYGGSDRQFLDFFPAGSGKGPLAMFIHGGWWRSLDPAQFSQMAKGPNAGGIDVAVVGYDLCPMVSIATIIGQARAACLHLWRKRKQRIIVCGHSAGGHLAACMVATDWKTLDPGAPADLVPAAYAISGVFDLTPLVHVSQNADLRLTDEAAAREVSPLYWRVPAGRSLDAVVGGEESGELLRQSRDIAQAWKQGMADTRYEEVPGANHFTVIDPLADANSAMTARVVELANGVAAMAL
ncbi:MAG: alpha/beta hydrolase [Pseudolabrys sp.]